MGFLDILLQNSKGTCTRIGGMTKKRHKPKTLQSVSKPVSLPTELKV